MSAFSDSVAVSGLALSNCLQIDRHCRSFERLWGTPQRRSIEAALASAPNDSADELLHELVAIEIELRRRQGERPTLAEYQQRFPTAAETVAKAFAEAAADEPSGTLEPPRPPERLGDFRIVREIGRGGMGVVYEAIQESLQRPVALKLLPMAAALNPTGLHRFRQEALTAAKLKHPNIVSIYDAGTQDGTPYIAMELIDGESLASLLRTAGEAKDSPRAPHRLEIQLYQPQFGSRYHRIAQIGRDIGRALEFAHTYRVLHRDVKPSNLLLDRHGVVQLADFGVARSLDDDGSLTVSGEFLGTLRYAAPETLQGQFDGRSDLYSLGVTLYELISRRPAFASATRESLLGNILRGNPQPWPAEAADCPRDLKTIIHKAMAREPRERYASAGELAQDLDLFLQGRPIRARRQTAWDHLQGWCRRQPLLATLAASLFLTLAVGFAATTWLWLDADAARNEMALGQSLALNAENRALQLQGVAEAAAQDLKLGLAEMQHQDALVQLQVRNDGQALSSVLAALQLAEGHPQANQDATFDAPNLSVVEANRYLAATLLTQMPTLIARNSISDRVASWTQSNRGLKLGRDLPSLVFHDDGQSLFVGSSLGGDVQRWDLSQDLLKPLLKIETVPGVPIHYVGPMRYAVVQNADRGMELWDVTTARNLCGLELPPGHSDEGLQMLGGWLSPDSRRLLLFYFSLGSGPVCRLYDVASGKLVSDLLPRPFATYGAHFSPDSKYLLTTGSAIQLWDTETFTIIREDFPIGAVPCFTSQQLVLGLPSELQIWSLDDLNADSSPRKLEITGDSKLSEMTCDPLGNVAIAGTEDGAVWIFDLTGTQAPRNFKHGTNLITHLLLNPSNREVLVADNSGLACVWDLNLGARSTPAIDHRAAIADLAWSPDSRQFATATANGELNVWKRAEHPRQLTNRVQFAELAPNLQNLLTADQSGNAAVWDYPRGTLTAQTTPPATPIAQALWAPQSNRVALIFGEGSDRAAVWDIHSSPLELLSFRIGSEKVENLTFTSDGQRLAILTPGKLAVHDVEPLMRQEPVAPPRCVIPLPPGPTSQKLLLLSDQKRLIGCLSPSMAFHTDSLSCWDPMTGRVLFKGMLPAGQKSSQILLSTDRQFLFAAGEYGLQVWDTRSWETLPLRDGNWQQEMLLLRQHPSLPYLAALGRDRVIRCLDYRSGHPLGLPFQISGELLELAWSADGKTLHTATASEGVRMWDWFRGEPVSPPMASGMEVKQAIFNHQRAEWLLVGSEAPYPLLVLTLPPPASSPISDLIEQAERLTGLTRSADNNRVRPLSLDEWRERRDRQRQSADAR